MTTNAFQLYDDLLPHVHSVTIVHPPHVALITRAQVMTDKIAARILAKLHAVGLLPPVWVPPAEVRDHRALVAQRSKMVRLSTQAKNRLHAVLHRHHLLPPEGKPFAARQARVVAGAGDLGAGTGAHPVRPGHPGLRPGPDRPPGRNDDRPRRPGRAGGAAGAVTRRRPDHRSHPPGRHRRHHPLPHGQAPGRLRRAWASACTTAA